MAALARITFDGETRSEIDLTEVGASRYCRHPTTICLCFGYQLPGCEPVVWTPDQSPPQDLFDAIENGLLVFAFNSFFEWCLWEFVMVPQHGWPSIPKTQYRDVMAQGNAIGLPNKLEEALPASGAVYEKNKEGRRIMLKLTKPRKPSKFNKDQYFNAPEDFEKLYEYCLDDVIGENELIDLTFPLNPFELEVWQFDQTVNMRGCCCDREAVVATLKLIEEIILSNEAELELITNGAVLTAGQLDRFRDHTASLGFPLPDLTADTVEAALKALNTSLDHDDGRLAHDDWQHNAETVKRMLEIRQENGKSSTKKFIAMLNRMDDHDDRIRGYLQYCGAYRTGRWAGRGIQPQNFPRGEFAKRAEEIIEMILAHDLDGLRREFGNPMSAISSAVRGMMIPAPNMEFVCADYNAIEARGVFWLSRDLEGLAVFRSGLDPYKVMASDIFGIPYDDINDTQRFLGKTAILGLGYRMGWARFMDTCEDQGVTITEELAKKIVDTYRTKYWRVCEFWDEVEGAAIAAIKDPSIRTRVKITEGYVEYFMHGTYLMCKLPSGRVIGYPEAELRDTRTPWGTMKESMTYMGMNSFNHQWERLSTHGGTLVENITQAVARDLLAFAMLTLEKAGYWIVLHIHDECVAEVLKGTANLLEYCRLMEMLPWWAKGFLVRCEGWIGQRYKKV